MNVDAFFDALSLKTIYMSRAVHLRKLLVQVSPFFKPAIALDHAQVASLKGIPGTLDAIAQELYGESFCKRTFASPREKVFSSVMKDHLLMQNPDLMLSKRGQFLGQFLPHLEVCSVST